jgi:hypothetical protein
MLYNIFARRFQDLYQADGMGLFYVHMCFIQNKESGSMVAWSASMAVKSINQACLHI